MLSSVLRRVIVVGAILAWPVMAYAQEAVSGTVRDTSGQVLPSVVVTATDEATGTTSEGVTDDMGVYRLTVRPGVWRISVNPAGPTTVSLPSVEVLAGQERTVDVELATWVRPTDPGRRV